MTVFCLVQIQVDVLLGDDLAAEGDGAVRGHFQKIERTEQGGFTAAGGADDDYHLALVNIDGYVMESLDLVAVVILFQFFDGNQYIIVHSFSASFQGVPPVSSER